MTTMYQDALKTVAIALRTDGIDDATRKAKNYERNLNLDAYKLVLAAATTLCKSGHFETGQGTCAAVCMDQLGDPRNSTHGCSHIMEVFCRRKTSRRQASTADFKL